MKKLFNNPIIFLIKFYRWIKALFPLSRCCRFEPSCSAYALECFEEFCFFKALWLCVKRILRCHPFCAGGFDPVRRNET